MLPLRNADERGGTNQSRQKAGGLIDSLIDEALATHSLHRADAAPRRTLIRRLFFDLTGLPPSPAEVDAFVRNTRPDAYSQLVERLLASPQYGERWARWWLDIARYADSNGQDENKVMANAWRYRDWVVRALNRNMPLDEFITCQLAGDLMPTNGISESELFDRWIATGFLVLGPKMLAEQDKQKLVMDLVDEQLDVVGRSFLGLTVGCARCHDHKFDPISTRDYYAMAGIFKSTRTMANLEFVSRFNERCISSRKELEAIEAHTQKLSALTAEWAECRQKAKKALALEGYQNFPAYLAAALHGLPSDSPLNSNLVARVTLLIAPDPVTNQLSRTLRSFAVKSNAVASFREDEDPNVPRLGMSLAVGKVGAAFRANGSNHLEISHASELDPELLTVESWVWADEIPSEGETRRWLVNKNQNEWAEGHYALLLDRDRPGVYLNVGGGKDHVLSLFTDKHRVKAGEWHHLAFSYDGDTLRLYVDGEPAAESKFAKKRQPGTGSLDLGRRQDGFVYFKGRLDEVRVYNRVLPVSEIRQHFQIPETVVSEGVVARWEFNQLTPEQQVNLEHGEAWESLFGPTGVFSGSEDRLEVYPSEWRDRLHKLDREISDLKAHVPDPPSYALAVTEDKVVDLPIHLRGSHLNLAKEPVPRGFIHGVSPEADRPVPTDRSGRWELARWIVSPQNPLSARVMVNRVWQAHFGEGLVRTPDNFGVRGERPSHPELLDALAVFFIQSGWDIKALHRLILNSGTYRQQAGPNPPDDPENRWLSHFPRQRLEAEMVRDALLSLSSRLDLHTGGTLVDWKNDDYVPSDTVTATSVRRSLYLPVVRDRGYDVFSIFDGANSSVCTARRTPTVVSHQALFFLNSPLVKAAARAIALETMNVPTPDEAARIGWVYQRIFNRLPSPAETIRSEQFLLDATRMMASDARKGAWAAYCQALLSANEFLYRD